MDKIYLKDYQGIMQLAQLYLDDCKEGKGEIMRPTFHMNATINGTLFKVNLMEQIRRDQLM